MATVQTWRANLKTFLYAVSIAMAVAAFPFWSIVFGIRIVGGVEQKISASLLVFLGFLPILLFFGMLLLFAKARESVEIGFNGCRVRGLFWKRHEVTWAEVVEIHYSPLWNSIVIRSERDAVRIGSVFKDSYDVIQFIFAQVSETVNLNEGAEFLRSDQGDNLLEHPFHLAGCLSFIYYHFRYRRLAKRTWKT